MHMAKMMPHCPQHPIPLSVITTLCMVHLFCKLAVSAQGYNSSQHLLLKKLFPQVREVLTRLTALRLLVQQQTELLTVLSTKYTKECAIQEQDSILKERFENIAALSASTSP
ncbi:uncharacterized protein LOC135373196 [Ornithodoros turicata]|uniref:uncharacterized protein LOC135373196 n=1 Tax=Ornithodoros turicata TaxID=34597 RepID=UPI003139A671